MKSRYRILIVDDDPMNIDILKEILEEEYVLKTAKNGEEALEIFPKFRPELVLLDIMMPGMTGYDVCRKIREDKNNSCKIILVSGKAMVEERLEGYDAGADDYVTKPFVDEELNAKVKVFLKLKRTEEVDKIKSDLLSLFSHETRTPLNGIIGMAQLLQTEESLNEDAREDVDLILESGYELLEFVKKTSLLCSLKSGTDLHKISDSLTNHLVPTIAIHKSAARERDITFELSEKVIELNADWSLIDEVLNYTIENAVKFSPAGGIVKVASESTENNTCLIKISDQGEGIDDEWIEKIFDAFAVKDLMHHNKGQGLSLAISRSIMELHGGSIDVESTPGKGTCFILTLPVDG